MNSKARNVKIFTLVSAAFVVGALFSYYLIKSNIQTEFSFLSPKVDTVLVKDTVVIVEQKNAIPKPKPMATKPQNSAEIDSIKNSLVSLNQKIDSLLVTSDSLLGIKPDAEGSEEVVLIAPNTNITPSEEITIKQPKSYGKVVLPVVQKRARKDSLTQAASQLAGIVEQSIPDSIQVEYKSTLLESEGYRFANAKLILFGISSDSILAFEAFHDTIFLNIGTRRVRLQESYNFRRF